MLGIIREMIKVVYMLIDSIGICMWFVFFDYKKYVDMLFLVLKNEWLRL